MSRGVCRNTRKLLPDCNTSRPSGASSIAASTWPPDLLAAALAGNRATRRLAMKNLRRVMRRDQFGGQ